MAFVMLAFGSPLSLGILVSVFSFAKIFIPYFYKKFEQLRHIFFWAAIILPIIAVLLLLVFEYSLFVVIFMGVHSVTRGIIFMEEEKTRLSATSYWQGGEKYVMESNLFFETALATGAITSAFSLILVGIFNLQWLVLLFLALTVSSFSLHGILIKRWQKKCI